MKKKNILFAAFLLISSMGIGQNQVKKDSFLITIKAPAQSVVKSLQLNGDDRYIEVMDLKKPNRLFRGAVTDYGMFSLLLNYYDSAGKKMSNTTVPLFMVPGETEIIVDKKTPMIQINGRSAIPRMDWAFLNRDDEEYQEQFIDYSGQLNTAMENKNREKIAQYDKKVKEIQAKRREVYARFAKRNPKSMVSFYAVDMFASLGGDPVAALELLDGLSPQLQITVTMGMMRERFEKEKTVMVGAPAPLFSQADTSGKMISLKDFQGKYVFLDFWASWCHPCREQNPGIVRMYGKFKEKNFTMISISLDSKRQSWVQAIRQDKLSWYQVSDLKFWNNEVAKLYMIYAVPQNILIDPQGKIIAKNLNEEEADELLGKLL